MKLTQKPLTASNLYIFSVAAKFLSFTKAAEELNLTQGAISQRIKQLELQLGFKLFVRLTRQLELTEEGRRLYDTAQTAFLSLFSDIDDIQSNELSGELYIGIAPTFAQSWLMPKLLNFKENYPNLNLKIRVKASQLDFQHEPVDIAIYYGQGKHPDMYSEVILEEHLTPVFTPEYADKHNINENIDCLANVDLVHCTESIDSASFDSEWNYWLSHYKKQTQPNQNYYVFNHGEMAISAVRNHLGAGMGRVALIQPYIDSGELVAPFERISAKMNYSLICPKGMEINPKLKAFKTWIHNQAPSVNT